MMKPEIASEIRMSRTQRERPLNEGGAARSTCCPGLFVSTDVDMIDSQDRVWRLTLVTVPYPAPEPRSAF